MTYIDGVVAPLKRGTSRDAFVAFAREAGQVFKDHGATRVVEAWGDDVPDGKVTDFRRAVQAGEGEVILFSWVEWPDKATRDVGMAKAMQDPRMQPGTTDVPLDGKRMIYGGFEAVLDF